MTALHVAAENGHIEVVRLLLDRHANIEAVDVVSQIAIVLLLSYYCYCLSLVIVFQ